MRKTLIASGGLLLILLWSGCASLKSSGIIQESRDAGRLKVGSKLMAEHVEIRETRTDRKNNLLAVNLVTENLTQKDLQCEYRFSWYDEKGMKVATPMSIWKPAHYHARARVNLTGVAPTAAVEEYRLVLRFRNPSSRF